MLLSVSGMRIKSEGSEVKKGKVEWNMQSCRSKSKVRVKPFERYVKQLPKSLEVIALIQSCHSLYSKRSKGSKGYLRNRIVIHSDLLLILVCSAQIPALSCLLSQSLHVYHTCSYLSLCIALWSPTLWCRPLSLRMRRDWVSQHATPHSTAALCFVRVARVDQSRWNRVWPSYSSMQHVTRATDSIV